MAPRPWGHGHPVGQALSHDEGTERPFEMEIAAVEWRTNHPLTIHFFGIRQLAFAF